MNNRWTVELFVCMGLLLVAACSKPPGSSTSSAPSTQVARIGPCGGLDAAQAAAILSIPVSDVAGPQTLKSFSRVYRSHKDFYKSITFNVYVAPDAAAAAEALGKDKEDLAFLSSMVAVQGLGDEAWYAPDPRTRRLLARKGAVWIDIVTPGDETSQRRIAKIVMANAP